MTYACVDLSETIEASELEGGEGDGLCGHEELMPEQGGSRGQPGTSKGKGREGGQSDNKKDTSEGTSEKAGGPERPRSCGEPSIAPSGGEGGSRQNILLGAELGSYDEVKVSGEKEEMGSKVSVLILKENSSKLRTFFL